MWIAKLQMNSVALCWGYLMNQQCVSGMQVELTLKLNTMWITINSGLGLEFKKDTQSSRIMISSHVYV